VTVSLTDKGGEQMNVRLREQSIEGVGADLGKMSHTEFQRKDDRVNPFLHGKACHRGLSKPGLVGVLAKVGCENETTEIIKLVSRL